MALSHRSPRSPAALRFELALLLGALLTLLAYKLYVAYPGRVGEVLVGLSAEALLLWLIWWLASALGLRSPALGRALFYPCLATLLLCSAAHAFYFDSAAERRFSLFEVGASGILYFFAHVLPAQGYLALSLVLAAALLTAWLASKLPLQGLAAHKAWVLAALALCAALGLMRVPRAPSPVVDAGADVWERLTTPSVDPLPGEPRYAPRTLDHSRLPFDAAALDSPFKKIVVLVMETMTSVKLSAESKPLPESTFVHSALPHVHRYERYFPNNQDSRTGMLDMLSARFIPYDAYTEEGRDHYMFLAERSSLPAQMQTLGFETAFAVSQSELELVVGDLPWQHTLHLTDAKLAAAQEAGLLCFVPYEFEHSCEDKALLPDVLAFLDAHERAFVYQEFIWGHASEYNDASGKSNAAYYSSYLDALVEHLRAQGTLDETLIVLTSDHGFRDTALQRELNVYRIPLWFYASRFTARSDDRLLSHLSFQELLHHERSLGATPIQESPFVMIYGPTGASLLAVLTRELDFMLLKLRTDSAFVLRHEQLGPDGALVGKARDADAPAAFLRLFLDYRSYFARQ